MKSPVSFSPGYVRQLFRSVASVLIIILVTQASPLPALAASANREVATHDLAARIARRDLSATIAEIKADLVRLETQGKEAFLDNLFERLDADEARALGFITAKIHQIGARKLCMAIVAIGSPVLAAVLAVVPESWQEKLVVAALSKFIRKAIREIKTLVAKLPAETLARGLKAVLVVAGNPRVAQSALRGDQTWWERFFSNSTAVRNFVITLVALSSIGVAVGLAIAGATAAPVVAVVGALVALIALIVPGPGGQLAEPALVD